VSYDLTSLAPIWFDVVDGGSPYLIWALYIWFDQWFDFWVNTNFNFYLKKENWENWNDKRVSKWLQIFHFWVLDFSWLGLKCKKEVYKNGSCNIHVLFATLPFMTVQMDFSLAYNTVVSVWVHTKAKRVVNLNHIVSM